MTGGGEEETEKTKIYSKKIETPYLTGTLSKIDNFENISDLRDTKRNSQ